MNQIQTRPSVEGIVNSLYNQQQERAEDMQDMYLTMRDMEASAPNFDAEQEQELNISFS